MCLSAAVSARRAATVIESRAVAEELHLLPADMPRTGAAERADAAEHAAIAHPLS